MFCQTVTSCLQVNAFIVMLIKLQCIISPLFFTVSVWPQVGSGHNAKHQSVLPVKAQRDSSSTRGQSVNKTPHEFIKNAFNCTKQKTCRTFQKIELTSKFYYGKPQLSFVNQDYSNHYICPKGAVAQACRVVQEGEKI